MPKARGLVNHVSIETAARQRVCHRHHTGKAAKLIEPGEMFLVVDAPVTGKQSYCLAAAVEFVAQARHDFDAIEDQLSSARLSETPVD